MKVCKGKHRSTAPINEISVDPNHEPNNWIAMDGDEEDQDINKLFVGSLSENDTSNKNLWYKYIKVCDEDIGFKLDTGSDANLIPEAIFNKLDRMRLTPTACHLITYTGERIKPKGEAYINIKNIGSFFK